MTGSLLAIKVSLTPSITHDSVHEHLSSIIQGTMMEFSDDSLASLTDLARVRKIYKLGDLAATKGGGSLGKKNVSTTKTGDEERLEISGIEGAVLGAMALRGAT